MKDLTPEEVAAKLVQNKPAVVAKPQVGDILALSDRKVYGKHAGHTLEVLEVVDLDDGSAEVLRRCRIDGDEWRVGWHPNGAPDND